MKQEKIELAKKWYNDKGFSVREHNNTLVLQIDGYEFELSESEIEYKSYAEWHSQQEKN